MACIRCGYNLRTLATAGLCPECGHPVLATVRNSLGFANPLWLDGLRSSSALLGWTPIGLAGACAVSVLLAFITGGLLAPLIPIVIVLGLLIAGLTYAAGVIGLTSLEPGKPDAGLTWQATLARLCPVVLVLAALVLLPVSWSAGSMLAATCPTVLITTLLLWPTMVALHARKLAERAADEPTVRFAQTAVITGAGLAVLPTCGYVAWLALPRSNSSFPPAGLIASGACFSGLAIVAQFMLVSALMFRARRMLERVVANGRERAAMEAAGRANADAAADHGISPDLKSSPAT